MLSPADGARHVKTTAPIQFVIGKVLDVTHLNKDAVILSSADGKSIIFGKLIANGLVYTFKPDTPLLSKTTYIIKLNASLIDANITEKKSVTLGRFTTASQVETMIFATKATSNGNLLARYSTESSSTAAADKICNSDENRPDKSISYKAMIGSNNRYGCDENNQCGPDFAKDWILAPNTTYYNTDWQQIFTTNEFGVYDFVDKLDNPFSNKDSSDAWTGLTDKWQKNPNTCNDWTSNHDGKTGRTGKRKATGSNAISYEQSSCESQKFLFCVPQLKDTESIVGALHIFVATHNGSGFHGDLQHSDNGGANGVIGADNKCNTSTDKPSSAPSGAQYKAILGSKNRKVCSDASHCGPDYQLDWALQPNTNYYRSDNTLIGTTTANSIFPEALTNAISGSQWKAWTGLSSTWVNVKDGNCYDWSSNSVSLGVYGITNSTSTTFINKTSDFCDKKRYLYCAEQPLVQMTEPAQGDRTSVPRDVTVKLAFPNDINEATAKDSTLRIDKVKVNKEAHVISSESVPLTIVVINSREFALDPHMDLESNQLYQVTESGVQNTAGGYEPGTTWYFTTSSGQPIMIDPPVKSRGAVPTETNFVIEYPDDADMSTIESDDFEVFETYESSVELSSTAIDDVHAQYSSQVRVPVKFDKNGRVITLDPISTLHTCATLGIHLLKKTYDIYGNVYPERKIKAATKCNTAILLEPKIPENEETAKNALLNQPIVIKWPSDTKPETIKVKVIEATTGTEVPNYTTNISNNISTSNAPADTLQSNTRYRINGSADRENGVLVAVEIEMTTLNRDDLLIFVSIYDGDKSHIGYNGNFNKRPNANDNHSVSRADRRCMDDIDHQTEISEGKIFKAVIAADDVVVYPDGNIGYSRYACSHDDSSNLRCDGTYQFDWPIAHNATYRNDSRQTIGRTDAYGRLPNPLTNPISPNENRVWTGMNSDYQVAYRYDGYIDYNCYDWSYSSSNSYGSFGYSNSVDSSNIYSSLALSCDTKLALYCAQIANRN